MTDETKPTDAPQSEPYPLPAGWWWDDDVADSRCESVWVDGYGDVNIGGDDCAPAAVVLAVLHRAGLLGSERNEARAERDALREALAWAMKFNEMGELEVIALLGGDDPESAAYLRARALLTQDSAPDTERETPE